MKTKTKKLELSVVIPVLNEEQNIKELAYEIDKALKNFSHEIIFVDDGSKDDTRNSVLALNNLKQVRLIVHKKCYGQSIAMRSCILKSNCDLIATLDGDGQNDLLTIIDYDIKSLSYFKVYNRWGQLLFETNSLSNGWDGTYKGEPQDMGTYIYLIVGYSEKGEKIVKKGDITLIR